MENSMATVLATRGWQRAACPPSSGSAGYVLDDNDICSVGVGVFQAGNFDQLASPTSYRTLPSYHTYGGNRSPAVLNPDNTLGDNTYPLFGKTVLKLASTSGGVVNVSTPYGNYACPAANDWTLSTWMYIPSTIGYAEYVYIDAPGTRLRIQNKSVALYLYPTWDGSTSSLPTNTWFYMRVIRTGATVKLYISGVEIGTITTRYATTSDVYALNIQGFLNSRAIFIRDFVVAKTARDGLFVPGNLLGF